MTKQFYKKAAKKFLDLNWEEKIYKDPDLRYDEVAPMLGFNTYRPSLRLIKKYFGFTIIGFFKHCRIMEVKQYLSEPQSRELELIDIAYKFGHESRRYFNTSFKDVTGITPQEFWFFHEHFVKTTGMTLVEYEQPETKIYMPADGKPTFLSNFLNRHAENINQNKTYRIKMINE